MNMTVDKMWEIVVVGSINTDFMSRSSKLPGPRATVRGGSFYTGPGGKGANQAVAAAIKLGHDAGACVILDPAPPAPLSDELLHMVSLIRPNADEAEALTGISVRDRASAKRAAEILLRRGVGAVAVGVGARGNLLVWRDGECWYPGIPIKSVDATGAGDAFVGALATRVAHGQTLAEASRFANAAAALATTKTGARAGLPTEHDVLQLLADHR